MSQYRLYHSQSWSADALKAARGSCEDQVSECNWQLHFRWLWLVFWSRKKSFWQHSTLAIPSRCSTFFAVFTRLDHPTRAFPKLIQIPKMGPGTESKVLKTLIIVPDAVNYLDTRWFQSWCISGLPTTPRRSFTGYVSNLKSIFYMVLKARHFSNDSGGEKVAFPVWKTGRFCLIR